MVHDVRSGDTSSQCQLLSVKNTLERAGQYHSGKPRGSSVRGDVATADLPWSQAPEQHQVQVCNRMLCGSTLQDDVKKVRFLSRLWGSNRPLCFLPDLNMPKRSMGLLGLCLIPCLMLVPTTTAIT